MKQYTRVLARVNLDAVEYNIEMMKKNIHKKYPDDGSHQNDGYGARGWSRSQNFGADGLHLGICRCHIGRGDTDQRMHV